MGGADRQIVQLERFAEWTDDDDVVDRLKSAVKAYATPEDINDNPLHAPSTRILAAMPGYQKTCHGPLIACEIGLDAMRHACPHFHTWLQKLEALNQDSFINTGVNEHNFSSVSASTASLQPQAPCQCGRADAKAAAAGLAPA